VGKSISVIVTVSNSKHDEASTGKLTVTTH